jgi:hypothetical protein
MVLNRQIEQLKLEIVADEIWQLITVENNSEKFNEYITNIEKINLEIKEYSQYLVGEYLKTFSVKTEKKN